MLSIESFGFVIMDRVLSVERKQSTNACIATDKSVQSVYLDILEGHSKLDCISPNPNYIKIQNGTHFIRIRTVRTV